MSELTALVLICGIVALAVMPLVLSYFHRQTLLRILERQDEHLAKLFDDPAGDDPDGGHHPDCPHHHSNQEDDEDEHWG